jgi:hypothetical protein
VLHRPTFGWQPREVPLSVRYSSTSRESRAAGERLLELTRGYDDLVVPAGPGVTTLAVLGMVGRARSRSSCTAMREPAVVPGTTA